MSKSLISSLAVIAFGVVILVVSVLVPQGDAAKALVYSGSGLTGLGSIFAFFALVAG